VKALQAAVLDGLVHFWKMTRERRERSSSNTLTTKDIHIDREDRNGTRIAGLCLVCPALKIVKTNRKRILVQSGWRGCLVYLDDLLRL
jgi:hypothetical protein